MELTFLVPSRPFPVGGVLAVYAYADALLGRGHRVRMVHVDAFGQPPARPEELTHLVTFDPRIDHQVVAGFTGEIDGGDVVFCFDERIPTAAGLPVMWVQSAGILAWEQEQVIYGAACPKICGSSWLRHVACALGNPKGQTVTAVPAVDTQRFRPVRPVEERPRRLLMVYGPHPAKGAPVGLRALREAKRRLPHLEATLFGTAPRPDDLPAWVQYVRDPPQETRAQAYSDYRCFLLPSRVEGFGITGIEAQACGTPLVATRNGGSADYAHHGVDALVADPDDPDALAGAIVAVMTDDALADRLSTAGRATATGFTWARAAEIIDGLLERYVTDPAALQRPVDVPPNPTEAGLSIERMLRDFYATR